MFGRNVKTNGYPVDMPDPYSVDKITLTTDDYLMLLKMQKRLNGTFDSDFDLGAPVGSIAWHRCQIDLIKEKEADLAAFNNFIKKLNFRTNG